jgi:hypothetical protein
MKNPEIIALAERAAESAMDAHSPGDLPDAQTAYEFIRQTSYEEFEGSSEGAEAVWNGMAMSTQDWTLFIEAYDNWILFKTTAPQAGKVEGTSC